uniref:sushi, von Willebrand factor type A, EGF and pentraxin domain-containing protein 1-like n=1 Tax=Styela clava TaxID=7725 RepID=UPI00193A2247|nr:sushi, von Willebrand factor type A, EGF and pentraxin domain-containing protein 1-like [Styela clava]
MKIPIRASFIGLILLVEAYLLIKGEQCWMPMICDDQPTWRDVNTERQCTKEQEEALEALTEQVHETESMLDQLQKRLEDLSTNSVHPSVVDVKETTTPQGYKDKKTTAPATSPWSTKEAFFSTFRPQTTKVEQSTVRTCPAPKAPDNGTALEVNRTIEYSCNAGYVLQGSNIGKCGENGTWGEVPTCVVRTCPAPKAPDNGTVNIATAFEVNQTIEYSCNAGYVLQGSNIGICRENGTWGEVPTCVVRTCPAPKAPDNGTVNTATALEVNQTIEYSCNAGYVLQGSNIGKCGENGTWGEVPACVVRTCPAPKAPDNGTVDTATALEVNQTIEYSCNAGYVLQGSNIGKCGENGTWGEVPTCVVRTCPAPKAPDNGTVDTATALEVNQTIEYSCNAGYVLQGSNIGKCGENGTWGEVPTCVVRTCPAPKAPDNGTVDTATALEVNQTIEYSCNAGYVLQGSNIGKCGENGTWGEVPTCVVRTCPAPRAPDNGTVDTATALEVNQTIEYSCNAGYVLQGSNIGKCGENGTWGEVPTCIDDLTCDFESSTNPTCSYTRVNGTFQREYRDDDVTGYVLAGNGTIRSLPKALAGNEELCMSVDIKDTSDGELVAKANNGTVTKAIWPFSASTTWKTEKFILKKVNSTDTEVQLELEASGNVELDNITTLNSSECYGLDTPCVKQNLENGTISPEQDLYSQDQEVSYSCNSNYTLEGGQTGTCKADGSWSITPVCTKCGVVYNSRCFRAIVYDAWNVTLSVAESICENKLANIYDVTHYNLLQDYLRPMIPDGRPFIYVRTGMNYTNGQLYSTTGQAMSLPTEVWYLGYPNPDPSSTSVVVHVNRDPENIYQGIFNDYPSSTYHGAICESEL